MEEKIFSSSTLSYFRFFVGFCIILAVYFLLRRFEIISVFTNLPNGETVVYLPILLLIFATFLFMIFSIVVDFVRDTKQEHFFSAFVAFLGILLFLPIYAFYRLFFVPLLFNKSENKKNVFPFSLSGFVQFFVLISLVIVSFFYFQADIEGSVQASETVLGQRLGIVADQIPIAGTGSMYPTFPKGESDDPIKQSQELVATAGMLPYPGGFSIFGKSFFSDYVLKRGDIVSFSNQKTREATMKKYGEEAGLIKRVIGMGGDRIELRDGILFINGHPQKEGYIAKPRSTFGGDFLADCRSLTVPPHQLFVLGDNRRASNDSRFEIGLIDQSDVDHVLPFEKQIGVVDALWRNPENDLSDTAKIQINKDQMLGLINQQRKKNGAEPLRFDSRLVVSAQKRGEKMIAFDDFSLEATKSGYGLQQAIEDSAYSNIIYGEFFVQGYYEADELMENLVEFPKTVSFLNKKEYSDFGFAEVTGLVNGCPTHVIVFHFGGYVPPNYKPTEIESWRKSLENLKSVRPSWERLQKTERFYKEYKEEVDQLLELINSGIESLDGIVNQMESNQWLTESQKQTADNLPKLYAQIEQLSKDLNEKTKAFQ